MSVRVGVNGFGRIGRDNLRCALERAETGTGTPVEVVAIARAAGRGVRGHGGLARGNPHYLLRGPARGPLASGPGMTGPPVERMTWGVVSPGPGGPPLRNLMLLRRSALIPRTGREAIHELRNSATRYMLCWLCPQMAVGMAPDHTPEPSGW
jgi:hypothetical protein